MRILVLLFINFFRNISFNSDESLRKFKNAETGIADRFRSDPIQITD